MVALEEPKGDNSSNQKKNYTSQILVSLVSGVGAGILCTIACAPFDVAKVRLQIQGALGIHKYSGGSVSIIRMIYREEGIRGVFKGVGPALFTVPLFWGVYWPIYDRMKSYCKDNYPEISSYKMHLSSAIAAGVAGDVITNPFWVTRTRIQTLCLHSEVHLKSNISTWDMIKVIYREEGILAFYSGLGASFLGLSHVAIQFPLYENLKRICREHRADGKETVFDLIGSSIAAKLVASTITYPHEVLRARLQDGRFDHNKSKSFNLITVTKDIIKKEGVAALWSGLRVNLVRIVPATCTSFVSYEYISRYLTDYVNGSTGSGR